MNECNKPFYIQPWAWFLFVCLVLFVTFIIVIETGNHLNTNDPMPEWLFIMFMFIILFLFISFIMYYWLKNRCAYQPVMTVIDNEIIKEDVMIEPYDEDYCFDYSHHGMLLSDLSPY